MPRSSQMSEEFLCCTRSRDQGRCSQFFVYLCLSAMSVNPHTFRARSPSLNLFALLFMCDTEASSFSQTPQVVCCLHGAFKHPGG